MNVSSNNQRKSQGEFKNCNIFLSKQLKTSSYIWMWPKAFIYIYNPKIKFTVKIISEIQNYIGH